MRPNRASNVPRSSAVGLTRARKTGATVQERGHAWGHSGPRLCAPASNDGLKRAYQRFLPTIILPAWPSRAVRMRCLPRRSKQALALVDVKVLDHFVVGGSRAMSFAERGLL
jgi:hypothetical protein